MTDRFSSEQNPPLDVQIYPHQGILKASTSNIEGVPVESGGILTTAGQATLAQISQPSLPAGSETNGANSQNMRPILVTDAAKATTSSSMPSPQANLQAFYAVQAVKCFLKAIQLAEGIDFKMFKKNIFLFGLFIMKSSKIRKIFLSNFQNMGYFSTITPPPFFAVILWLLASAYEL